MSKSRRSADLWRASRGLGLLLPALLVAACDRVATSPSEIEGPSISAGASLATHSSRPRYRDSGRSNATGRSGTATLTGFAVMGPDGVVRLTLASGGLADPGSGRGQIAKAQVKVFGADGSHLATLNFQKIDLGVVTLSLPGIPASATLKVQANVRGIDGKRTDVVELTDSVRLAPGLGVDLNAADGAYVGVPTPITAVVSEVNGDVGVYATCILRVNGQQVDVVTEVWVDAGDAVTCAFTHTFTSTGEQQLEVLVSYDPGTGPLTVSDSSSLSIGQPSALTYSGSADDVTTEIIRTHEYTWQHPNGARKAYSSNTADGVREQTIALNGTLNRPVTWPVAVSLRATSGFAQWLEEDWSGLVGVPGVGGMACISQGMPDGGVFQLCSNGVSPSVFAYTRFGGSVTYRSWGWVNQWDDAGALVNGVTWNDGYETSNGGAQARPWQGSVSLGVEVSDAQGSFSAQPVIPLSPFDETELTVPTHCESDYPYWLEGNPQVQCWSERVRRYGQRGTTAG